MSWNFKKIEQDVEEELRGVLDEASLEALRIKYLGRKGLIQEMYASLGTLPPEEKPGMGKNANALRVKIVELISGKKNSLSAALTRGAGYALDVSLPGVSFPMGRQHLLSRTIEEICGLFEKMGFVVMEGPEIETEENNFEGLNIPADHPSRDGFDTFYLDIEDPQRPKKNLLLRSHTSPGQIRIMKAHKPPLAVVIPGKVFRPDAVDASHSFMFHQIEGLLVDENIRFSHLKGLLMTFCKRFFGDDVEMRFRPHFFPFTEPSAEVDISWKHGRKDWLEIMGCGLVHPAVFKAVGYPHGKYTGLAFGLGVERIAMLRHGINDIRVFFENDQRFLDQF